MCWLNTHMKCLWCFWWLLFCQVIVGWMLNQHLHNSRVGLLHWILYHWGLLANTTGWHCTRPQHLHYLQVSLAPSRSGGFSLLPLSLSPDNTTPVEVALPPALDLWLFQKRNFRYSSSRSSSSSSSNIARTNQDWRRPADPVLSHHTHSHHHYSRSSSLIFKLWPSHLLKDVQEESQVSSTKSI